jgi:hypothetical protein
VALAACGVTVAAGLMALGACGATLNLGANDAGIAYDAACKPGTYAGSYLCNAGQGALSTGGPIAITLVPAGAASLALSPDASLSASGSGTTFVSSLAGVLDCPTAKLSGALSNISVMSPTFDGIIPGSGEFSATYDTEGGSPSLVDGVMNPPPSAGTTCTWTAQLQ